MSSDQTIDAVVIGAGAVGCAVALQLVGKELKVLVIERDGIAFNASAYAWGGLSAHFGNGVPGPMTDIYRDAIARHLSIYEELSPSGDEDWQLQRVTSLSLADDEEMADRLACDVGWMRSEGFDAEMLSAAEIYKLEPAVREGMIAASMVNAGWELDSLIYTCSLAAEAERRGVEFRAGMVESVETDPQGVVESLVLKDGERIHTPLIVAATGPWVSDIKGIPELPVVPIKGEILRLERAGSDLQNRVGFGGFNVGRKPDGMVWAGTYEWECGFNREVTDKGRQHILNGATAYVPSLSESRIVKSTACLRPVSVDGFPIVGASAIAEGLYYANGAGKKGILLSLLMADWIVGSVFDGCELPQVVSAGRFGNI